MLKKEIIKAYEKESGVSLREDDPIVTIAFLFETIMQRNLKITGHYYMTLLSILFILIFVVGFFCGYLIH